MDTTYFDFGIGPTFLLRMVRFTTLSPVRISYSKAGVVLW